MKWVEKSFVLKVQDFSGGISLGKIVIVNSFASDRMINHELSHSKQSLWLGPLYLVVIGIPSLVHSIIHSMCNRSWNYYSFYTEAWAEKIRKKYYIN